MTRQNAGQQQVAFYDVGPGSQADGANIFGRAFRALHNIIAQATGFGITRNIIDCYAALILWRPGDRIFLIEFSRGAYAVRCLAGVIARCGIPVHPKNDPNGILPTDPGSAQELAAYAVKHFYQFTREQNFSTVASQRLSSWKESHGLAVQAGQPHNRTEAISSFENRKRRLRLEPHSRAGHAAQSANPAASETARHNFELKLRAFPRWSESAVCRKIIAEFRLLGNCTISIAKLVVTN